MCGHLRCLVGSPELESFSLLMNDSASRFSLPLASISVSRLLYRMLWAPSDDLQSRFDGELMLIELASL